MASPLDGGGKHWFLPRMWKGSFIGVQLILKAGEQFCSKRRRRAYVDWPRQKGDRLGEMRRINTG